MKIKIGKILMDYGWLFYIMCSIDISIHVPIFHYTSLAFFTFLQVNIILRYSQISIARIIAGLFLYTIPLVSLIWGILIPITIAISCSLFIGAMFALVFPESANAYEDELKDRLK